MDSTNKAPAKGMFLVERYWPGISRERLADAEERMSRAASDLVGSGVEIRILSSMLIPAEEVVLTVFEAADEEDVIEVSRLSEVSFDRVQPVEMSQIHPKGASNEDYA